MRTFLLYFFAAKQNIGQAFRNKMYKLARCIQMELKDITTVKIDSSLPKEQKIKQFIEDLENPYEFKVGDVLVKVSFNDGGTVLQETMLQYFKMAAI